MPLLRVNAGPAGLALHDRDQTVAVGLQALADRPGPAVIMLHGYKYAPRSARHCPHRKILGDGPRHWPAQLGFGTGDPGEGIGIALGWSARGPLRAMHARASALGADVASLIGMIHAADRQRPVHVIAHSLGAETALMALAHLPARSIDRMVLLTGASHAGRARDLLDTPAGRTVEVLNVTSRENDLFDAAFETVVPSDRPRDRALGHGIDAANVANVQLDCPRTLQTLARLGFVVGAPERRICHWSAYRRVGVMGLYAAFLRAPDRFPIGHLAAQLPVQRAPRWSRLLALPRLPGTTDRALPRFLHPVIPDCHFQSIGIAPTQKNEPAC